MGWAGRSSPAKVSIYGAIGTVIGIVALLLLLYMPREISYRFWNPHPPSEYDDITAARRQHEASIRGMEVVAQTTLKTSSGLFVVAVETVFLERWWYKAVVFFILAVPIYIIVLRLSQVKRSSSYAHYN